MQQRALPRAKTKIETEQAEKKETVWESREGRGVMRVFNEQRGVGSSLWDFDDWRCERGGVGERGWIEIEIGEWKPKKKEGTGLDWWRENGMGPFFGSR